MRLLAGFLLAFLLLVTGARAQEQPQIDPDTIRAVLVFEAYGFEVPAEDGDQDFLVGAILIWAKDQDWYAANVPVFEKVVVKICRLVPNNRGYYSVPLTISEQKQYCTIHRGSEDQLIARQSP